MPTCPRAPAQLSALVKVLGVYASLLLFRLTLQQKRAVEVEVATRPDKQGNGFAKKLGAAMILESLNRDMFPLWDAHNEASKKVAEFLGYELVEPYEAFELEESVV